jgi:hypothetical protein
MCKFQPIKCSSGSLGHEEHAASRGGEHSQGALRQGRAPVRVHRSEAESLYGWWSGEYAQPLYTLSSSGLRILSPLRLVSSYSSKATYTHKNVNCASLCVNQDASPTGCTSFRVRIVPLFRFGLETILVQHPSWTLRGLRESVITSIPRHLGRSHANTTTQFDPRQLRDSRKNRPRLPK